MVDGSPAASAARDLPDWPARSSTSGATRPCRPMAALRGSESPTTTRSLQSPLGTWSCSEHCSLERRSALVLNLEPFRRDAGGRKADGAPGHGIPSLEVPGRGRDADAARAARGRVAGSEGAGHGVGEAIRARSAGVHALVRFLRAGRFNVIQPGSSRPAHGRVAAPAGTAAGDRHGRDGRRPLEESRASWRSTAGWRSEPTAWWATARAWSIYPRESLPNGWPDPLGDRRREAAAG